MLGMILSTKTETVNETDKGSCTNWQGWEWQEDGREMGQ